MKRLESLVQSTARYHNSVVKARCLCDVTIGGKLSRRRPRLQALNMRGGEGGVVNLQLRGGAYG
jgi:hypothetical protein